jgi:hypothetical protein
METVMFSIRGLLVRLALDVIPVAVAADGSLMAVAQSGAK